MPDQGHSLGHNQKVMRRGINAWDDVRPQPGLLPSAFAEGFGRIGEEQGRNGADHWIGLWVGVFLN
jgi:hypothetical protein